MKCGRRIPSAILLLSLLFSATGSAAWAAPVQAAGNVVTETGDYDPAVPGSRIDGTLRAVVEDADGFGTITFAPDLANQTITLTGGPLTLDGFLAIDASSLSGPVTVSGYHDRVLIIPAMTSVTITGLNITGGSYTGAGGGGCIYNAGSLTLYKSTVSGCSAEGNGGAVFNTGDLTLEETTLSGNTSNGNGGGIFSEGSLGLKKSRITDNTAAGSGGGIDTGSVSASSNIGMEFSTIADNTAGVSGGGINIMVTDTGNFKASTISGNTAGLDGGGVMNDGRFTGENVTISGNLAAGGDGGGVYSAGRIVLYHGTISGNMLGNPSAGLAGGLFYSFNDRSFLYTSVLANSSGGADCVNSGSLLLTAATLIEDDMDSQTCNPTISADPRLGPLADNGGYTFTHALLSGSPAIDVPDPDHLCRYEDQRGLDRSFAPPCDLGAFEYGYDGADPVVELSDGTPANGAVLTAAPVALTVAFSKRMASGGWSEAADYPANYRLLEWGANKKFDTGNCAASVAPDDTTVVINSAAYDPTVHTTVLQINGGIPLPLGRYRLQVCGTTSVTDLLGQKINNGLSDTLINFTVSAPPGGSAGSGAFTPSTGFAPGRPVSLPEQPSEMKYALPELTLEIPSLGVKTDILGVPLMDDGWDLTWLGGKAGYLYGSAFPTWEGNSVITGHVWNADNTPGIFAGLKNLQAGDAFTITAYGEMSAYQVSESFTVKPDQSGSVMKSVTGRSVVTLVTCEEYDEDSGTYRLRRLVRAERVETK